MSTKTVAAHLLHDFHFPQRLTKLYKKGENFEDALSLDKKVALSLLGITTGALFTTVHFLCNLYMDPISYSVI
jgi:hypothetical protein